MAQSASPARRRRCARSKELDFAAIGSLHANKARGGSFRQSVQGSHAFNAISKSSLLVAKHPDGPEERRVVARGKGNYAVRPVSQEFTIVGKSPKIGDHVIRTSVATDFKDSPLTADDLLAPPQREPTSKSGRARAYIQQALGRSAARRSSDHRIPADRVRPRRPRDPEGARASRRDHREGVRIPGREHLATARSRPSNSPALAGLAGLRMRRHERKAATYRPARKSRPDWPLWPRAEGSPHGRKQRAGGVPRRNTRRLSVPTRSS